MPPAKSRQATTLPAVDSAEHERRTERAAAGPSESEQQAAPSDRYRDPERYSFIGEHGRGGLGRVLRAYDRHLQRDIAIKELFRHDETSEARFAREALITANLEHPGIVPVYEAGRWPDDTPFYAMKLVSGRPLRELILESDNVAKRITLLHHVIAVADAIAYAHQRGIIHRDLKPANIIVGDFGETIVIDWGLAKNLADSDEVRGHPEASIHRTDHPNRTAPQSSRSNELTSAGAVLGTPVYMAPEQERGERVDQRADVFSIGAMLWELCSLQRVPPTSPRQRADLLRSAGIDQDLGAIINKCLGPDRELRYADAGELAADLKAFKSGSRVAARHYSLAAVLAHWLRRHRALAVSLAAALVVAVTSVAIYVRNIATERDRAEQATNAVTLENAALLLHSDPTSALAAVSAYRGAETQRAARIAAEARGRGVARVLNVHNDHIYLAEGTSGGAIVSVGEDRRIRLTQPDGTTKTLADDVAIPPRVAYGAARQLLAYSPMTSGVVVLSIATQTTERLTTVSPEYVAFSRDGTRLAIIDKESHLTIFSVEDNIVQLQQLMIDGARLAVFSDANQVLVPTKNELHIVSAVDGSKRTVTESVRGLIATPDWLAGVNVGGAVTIYNAADLNDRREAKLCRDAVRSIQFIPNKPLMAFACEEGVAGTVDIPSLTERERIILLGSPVRMRSSDDGRYVLIATNSATVYVYDTHTRLTARYEGQAGRVSSMAPPTATHQRIIVGDVNGTIREWNLPDSTARLVAHVKRPLLHAAVTPDAKSVVFSSNMPSIFRVGLSDGSITERIAHQNAIQNIRFSPDGRHVISNSFDGTARVFDIQQLSLVRTQDGHNSRVEDVTFTERNIISAGDDGRLLSWNLHEDATHTLFKTDRPLMWVETLSNQSLAVTDTIGRAWVVKSGTSAAPIREANGDLVTTLLASSDGNILAIGTEQGNLTVHRPDAWKPDHHFRVTGSLRKLAFSPNSAYLVAITESKGLYLFALGQRAAPPWSYAALDIRDAAFSPDGDTLALVCRDGGLWFYSLPQNRWTFRRDHYAATSFGRFSFDGRWFVSAAEDGTVVLRDVPDAMASPPPN